MKKKLLFTVTAAALALLPTSIRAQLLSTSSGTVLYGNVIYCESWEEDDNMTNDEWPVGIYSFRPVAPSMTKALCTDKRLQANGGGYYRDGKFCFFNYKNLTISSTLTYYEADVKEKKFTKTVENIEDKSLRATDLTYDRTTGNVYGQFFRKELGGRCIGVLNLDDMSHSNIVNTTTTYVSIAADKDGKLYAISQEGDLYIIDKTSGEQTKIGATGVKPGEYRMSATFDWNTNILYWACVHEDGTSALYNVDTATGLATKVMDFRDSEQIVGMYALPPAANDGAPAKVTDLACNFTGASTTGTVTFTAPSKTFRDAELTGKVAYVIADGDKELATAETEPGTAISKEVTLAEGSHDITVYTKNSEGKSEDASVTLWVGYDDPTAVTDIKVSTVEGTKTTKVNLTWTAPEKGVHDGYFDKNELKYDVVRLPDYKKVATGITECSANDELDESAQLEAYRYEITAYHHGRTSIPATSDNVVAGSAKEVPYTVALDKASDMSLLGIVDMNGDNYTWTYDGDEKAACYRFSVINTADDWLLSAPLLLYKDKKYKLAFDTRCGASYSPENIEAAVGKGNDPTLYENIMKNTEVDNDKAYKTLSSSFEVKEDGVYRIGLHAISPSYRFKLFVRNISVTLDNTTGINSVDADGNGKCVVYDLFGRKVAQPRNGVYIVNGKKVVVNKKD